MHDAWGDATGDLYINDAVFRSGIQAARKPRTDPVSACHASVQTTERYIGSKQKLQDAVNDPLEISVASDSA